QLAEGAPPPLRRRRGPGLRVRLTLLATGLTAGVSGILLWLGWLLVSNVVSAVPQFPAGSTVVVDGLRVDAEQLRQILIDHARDEVLRVGSVAFLCVVLAAAILSWTMTERLLRPLQEVT